MRRNAIVGLGSITGLRAIPVLRQLAKNDDAELRETALGRQEMLRITGWLTEA